ncbi:cytoplasmic protein [Bacillus sp. 03113]|uniref:cytoplasmic protein n=1 Tax=Bacillus sp. 03113 TaxID=2578211 RepID=UPI001144DCA0|nr:cytoplasmic protein [Bacillus sp. 03113]
MNISIDEKAFKWFKEGLEVNEGEAVRFLIGYEEEAMNRPFHPGFSLKFLIDSPNLLGPHIMKEGILFYIEVVDEVIFQDKNLFVRFDKEKNDISFELVDRKLTQIDINKSY